MTANRFLTTQTGDRKYPCLAGLGLNNGKCIDNKFGNKNANLTWNLKYMCQYVTLVRKFLTHELSSYSG